MAFPELVAEADVSQRRIILGELTQLDLDRIVDVTGARVVVKTDSLRRISLLHLDGFVVSIDPGNWRDDSSQGPFLSVSSEDATQLEIPALLNPSVTITPESVTFTQIIIDKGGIAISRHVEMSKGSLACRSSVIARRG